MGRRVTQNFQLQVGDISQVVTVPTNHDLLEQSTMAIGHVVDQNMVQGTPLNGRYFLDLGLRVPGSVTPPQGAFLRPQAAAWARWRSTPAAIAKKPSTTMVNGITLNNLTFSSISFQLPINTIQEFKLDNSTFSAQYGQSSGAIVNIATRSGANQFHGEVFEFFRNDALDARNFFELTSSKPAPFKRNQFGGNVGGPIIKKKLFFFFAYEGLRQRQGLNLNSVVLSDAQRASVTDPVIAKISRVDSASELHRLIGYAAVYQLSPARRSTSISGTTDINYNLSVNETGCMDITPFNERESENQSGPATPSRVW